MFIGYNSEAINPSRFDNVKQHIYWARQLLYAAITWQSEKLFLLTLASVLFSILIRSIKYSYSTRYCKRNESWMGSREQIAIRVHLKATALVVYLREIATLLQDADSQKEM